MDSQLFLIINIICVIIFSLWFLLGRKTTKNPTTLILKQGDLSNGKSLLAEEREHKTDSELIPLSEESERSKSSQFQEKKVNPMSSSNGRKEKTLNVLFMYNGHDWDAYKVLGVPAGSNIRVVTEAFQQVILNGDPDTVPFLEAAYQAILDHINKKRIS